MKNYNLEKLISEALAIEAEDARQAGALNRMIEMYDEQKNTVAEICKIYNISRPSFYNYLNNRKRELGKQSGD